MAVEHVNALTKRWLATAGAEARVLSGLGVWPPLAFLADAGDDEARADLSAALGIPAEQAARAAREVLAIVARTPAIRTAIGLWTRNELRVRAEWLERLPAGVHGELTGVPADDRKRLDAWASEHTDGLIPRMPIEVDEYTLLVLASALLVTVAWREEFTGGGTVSEGPWADARGPFRVLRRVTSDLDLVRVVSTPIGPLTSLVVQGDEDVDVHLVLGPADRSPAEVLAAGTEVVGAPRHPMTRGTDLPDGDAGPGIRVAAVDSAQRRDRLEVTTVPFRLQARHDLLRNAALFGLQRARSGPNGRFPGISGRPLLVSQAVQDAVAEFSATGFRAAAVTAFGMVRAAAMPAKMHRVRQVAVTFDRPFAYYAVHRDSGLILVAGWVGEPVR